MLSPHDRNVTILCSPSSVEQHLWYKTQKVAGAVNTYATEIISNYRGIFFFKLNKKQYALSDEIGKKFFEN